MKSLFEDETMREALRGMGFDLIDLANSSGQDTKAPCDSKALFSAQVLFAHRDKQDDSEEEVIEHIVDIVQSPILTLPQIDRE